MPICTNCLVSLTGFCTKQQPYLPLIKLPNPKNFAGFYLYPHMKNNKLAYWWCQIGGWSAYMLIWIFFYHAIRTRTTPHFYENILLDASLGLLLTHLMRTLAKSLKLFQFSIRQQIVAIVLISFAFALIDGIILTFLQNMVGIIDQKYTFWNRSIRASFSSVLILLIWNLIYFMYHYILKTRQEQFDKIRLESLVKELELKTIKAHINPHFIFNALNSIRALVDENPVRARTAITELSNILRSSMQAEKAETSPLEKELNIVKDYLALEHIRFEDRLRVEYDIDEDTLDQPVPPMMLQTLVENAIKHGISKQKDGGLVKVISDFRDNHHELIIQNTGQLNGTYNVDGFGIASTQNRLALLFGSKAHFELKDINGNIVEAKVIMPVSV
jgi:two-component system LytT family sensor kinase